MRLTGTPANGRGRFSVPIIGALVSLPQQFHLHLFHLLWVVGPNLCDQCVVRVTKGMEPGPLRNPIV